MAGLESSIEETVKMLIKKIDEKGEISSEVMFGFTTVVEEVDRAKEVVENVSKSFVAISSHIENDSIHNTKESMQEIAEEKAAEAVKEHAKQEGIHTTTQEKMQFGVKVSQSEMEPLIRETTRYDIIRTDADEQGDWRTVLYTSGNKVMKKLEFSNKNESGLFMTRIETRYSDYGLS